MVDLNKIKTELELVLKQFFVSVNLREDDILVVGCSTSAVCSEYMGTASSPEVAAVLYDVIIEICNTKRIAVAFQCCEHLNRALVVERAIAEKYNLIEVSVLPQVKAGGALATRAYAGANDPIVVESIQGHAAIDIGSTLIGMHVRPVAVPVRLKQKNVGGATVTAARSRPKLIGGIRAVYPAR